tara:strand:+ start:145 stop:552 length:408 start_codon:yes stop_codon:yes gene_type:complete
MTITTETIRTLRQTLPTNSLVLHDVFGFGHTDGIVQCSTGSVDDAWVAVRFDDDDYRINNCLVGEGVDEETGETYKYGYRRIRLSYLELDQEQVVSDYCQQARDVCEARAEKAQLDEDEEDEAAYAAFLADEFDG